MFDVLIREAGARFGLGDKALPVAQMLLAYMTDRERGGLGGFLEKFKAAGLGPIVQSWLGGGPAAQPLANSQVESVLGASGGLLPLIAQRLAVNRDHAASAIGYLVPAVVGLLTPGGSLPSSLPAEVNALAAAGKNLLAAPAVTSVAGPAAAAGAAWMKWLPWLVLAAAVLIGLTYCGRSRTPTVDTTPAAPAVPASEPASEPAAVAAFGGSVPTEPASAAVAPQPAAVAASEASAVPAPAASAPVGSAVESRVDAASAPMVVVYFDSASAAVHPDFAARAADLVAYLTSNSDARAVISGFNDPTGNAAANAELSKNRAQAVQKALIDAGVPEARTTLEKPAETSGTAATDAASRRVEVTVRR